MSLVVAESWTSLNVLDASRGFYRTVVFMSTLWVTH